MNTQKKEIIKKRILPTILVALSLPFVIFFFGPFDIYVNNRAEFMFSLADFLPITLAFGLLMAVCAFFGLLFLPERLHKIFSNIWLTVAVMCFLQNLFLNNGLNSLTGDNVESSAPSTGLLVINTVIWAIAIGLAIGLPFINDKKGIMKYISLVLSIVIIFTHVINFAVSSITEKGVYADEISETVEPDVGGGTEVEDKKEKEKIFKFTSVKDLTTISSNKNVFIFVIDRFDEAFAEEAFNEKPELFDMLEGFTWFNDYISSAGQTYPSLAQLITGIKYDPAFKREKYLNKAYEENKTLSVLNENNYLINLFSESYYTFTSAYDLPDYINNVVGSKNFKVTDKVALSRVMLQTSLFRYGPALLKLNYSSITSDSFNSLVDNAEKDGYKKYVTKNEKVLYEVKHTPFNVIEQNVCSVIHTEGIHDVKFDSHNYTRHPSKGQIEKITNLVEINFEIIKEYIQALKDIGAYKDATIIITGDHGSPPDTIDYKFKHSSLTALFVKPSGADEGKVKISTAEVSHENIWPTIMQSENIQVDENYGHSVFEDMTGKEVKRYFAWHSYIRGWFDEWLYEITGAGRDWNNWKMIKYVHYTRFIMD